MIKKFFISIGLLFSFFLMFLFGFDKINVLAYSDIGNALGSYPVKLDIDNYNRNNLLNLCEFNSMSSNGITSTINNNCLLSFSGTATTTWADLTNNKTLILPAGTYTISITQELNFYFVTRFSYNNDSTYDLYLSNNETSSTFTLNQTAELLYFFADNLNSGTYYSINDLGVQIEKGTIATVYGNYFKFGYNVHYNVVLSNSSSSNINAGIGIYDGNKYLYSANCNVPANSNGTICSSSNNPVYLPFNVDNNGYISFNYNLSLTVGPQSSISIKDGGLAFENVFNAYYKGEYTENLYFKQTYTMNNISLSGFSISATNSNSNDIIFPSTSYDNVFIINSNNEYNISTNKKFNTTFTNNFNYKNFIYDNVNNIYDFAIKIPDDNIGINYNISISNLMARVVGDTGNVAPLPGDSNTIKKYNECSAWYDIPCQLGNAVTYVIYEAPIISPVLTFIVSFITMFSSLVSFVDLFRSFGIVFGCFIIYMFIELLHKYSK